MKILTFSEAENYLSDHIPADQKNLFTGGKGRDRTKYLLGLLGNPQDKLKVIHIAGTSGKSSTSYLLSLMLSSVNKRAGLFISPHITDITERIRINNELITEQQFVRYLNELIPFIERTEKSEFGKPTYFEILTALAFYFFYKEKVDYAVMETGLGGLMDATNVVNRTNKVCIITRIGMDHVEILGNTIKQIAEQKAGIITKNAIVITSEQEEEVISVIKNVVKIKGAKLYILKEGLNYRDIQEEKDKTIFSFYFLGNNWQKISLRLLGKYQAENCGLALCALMLLSKRDGFVISEKQIQNYLERADFFGRLSRYRIEGKTVIIDGAHNEQKMGSFIQAISRLYPGKKFNFLIAFKKGKDFVTMLEQIMPIANKIIITSFVIKGQEWLHESVRPETVASTLVRLGFSNYRIVVNAEEALEYLLKPEEKSDIVITGSFYLIGVLYKEIIESKKSVIQEV